MHIPDLYVPEKPMRYPSVPWLLCLLLALLQLGSYPEAFGQPSTATRIFFHALPAGTDRYIIYSVNPDGTGMQPLFPQNSAYHRISPTIPINGSKLYYWRRKNFGTPTSADSSWICRSDFNGANEEVLWMFDAYQTTNIRNGFSVNTSESKLYFATIEENNRDGDVFELDLGTFQKTQLTSNSDFVKNCPTISADGLRLAYAQNGTTWYAAPFPHKISNSDGTSVQTLGDPNWHGSFLAFSSDNQYLVRLAHTSLGQPNKLYIASAFGENTNLVTFSDNSSEIVSHSLAIDPTSSKIATIRNGLLLVASINWLTSIATIESLIAPNGFEAFTNLDANNIAWGGISIPETPKFAFSSASQSIAEGNSGQADYTYNVTLSGATVFPASVQVVVASQDGQAFYSTTTANRDWTLLPGSPANRTRTLTFNTNGTQAVTIRVYGDTRIEGNEVLNLTLLNPVNGTIEVANQSRTHTIANDEVVNIGGGGANPDVNFTGPASVTVLEGSNVNIPLLTSNVIGTFTFEVSYGFDRMTTNWGYASNQPIAGGGSPADWRPYPISSFVTQFTLGNNQTRNVQIVAFADAVAEGNETVVLSLPGTGGQKQVTVTIQNVGAREISDEEFTSSAIIVYPNPTTGRFFVETASEGLIEVRDLTGRLVLSQVATIGTNELNLATEATGVYTVRINDQVVKLVKN